MVVWWRNEVVEDDESLAAGIRPFGLGVCGGVESYSIEAWSESNEEGFKLTTNNNIIGVNPIAFPIIPFLDINLSFDSFLFSW